MAFSGRDLCGFADDPRPNSNQVQVCSGCCFRLFSDRGSVTAVECQDLGRSGGFGSVVCDLIDHFLTGFAGFFTMTSRTKAWPMPGKSRQPLSSVEVQITCSSIRLCSRSGPFQKSGLLFHSAFSKPLPGRTSCVNRIILCTQSTMNKSDCREVVGQRSGCLRGPFVINPVFHLF